MLSFRFTADWVQGQPRDGEVVGSTTRPVSLSLMFVPPTQLPTSNGGGAGSASAAAAAAGGSGDRELALFELNVFSTKTPMQPQSSRGEVAVSKATLWERLAPTTDKTDKPVTATAAATNGSGSGSGQWSNLYHSCVIKKHSLITSIYRCDAITTRWDHSGESKYPLIWAPKKQSDHSYFKVVAGQSYFLSFSLGGEAMAAIQSFVNSGWTFLMYLLVKKTQLQADVVVKKLLFTNFTVGWSESATEHKMSAAAAAAATAAAAAGALTLPPAVHIKQQPNTPVSSQQRSQHSSSVQPTTLVPPTGHNSLFNPLALFNPSSSGLVAGGGGGGGGGLPTPSLPAHSHSLSSLYHPSVSSHHTHTGAASTAAAASAGGTGSFSSFLPGMQPVSNSSTPQVTGAAHHSVSPFTAPSVAAGAAAGGGGTGSSLYPNPYVVQSKPVGAAFNPLSVSLSGVGGGAGSGAGSSVAAQAAAAAASLHQQIHHHQQQHMQLQLQQQLLWQHQQLLLQQHWKANSLQPPQPLPQQQQQQQQQQQPQQSSVAASAPSVAVGPPIAFAFPPVPNNSLPPIPLAVAAGAGVASGAHLHSHSHSHPHHPVMHHPHSTTDRSGARHPHLKHEELEQSSEREFQDFLADDPSDTALLSPTAGTVLSGTDGTGVAPMMDAVSSSAAVDSGAAAPQPVVMTATTAAATAITTAAANGVSLSSVSSGGGSSSSVASPNINSPAPNTHPTQQQQQLTINGAPALASSQQSQAATSHKRSFQQHQSQSQPPPTPASAAASNSLLSLSSGAGGLQAPPPAIISSGSSNDSSYGDIKEETAAAAAAAAVGAVALNSGTAAASGTSPALAAATPGTAAAAQFAALSVAGGGGDGNGMQIDKKSPLTPISPPMSSTTTGGTGTSAASSNGGHSKKAPKTGAAAAASSPSSGGSSNAGHSYGSGSGGGSGGGGAAKKQRAEPARTVAMMPKSWNVHDTSADRTITLIVMPPGGLTPAKASVQFGGRTLGPQEFTLSSTPYADFVRFAFEAAAPIPANSGAPSLTKLLKKAIVPVCLLNGSDVIWEESFEYHFRKRSKNGSSETGSQTDGGGGSDSEDDDDDSTSGKRRRDGGGGGDKSGGPPSKSVQVVTEFPDLKGFLDSLQHGFQALLQSYLNGEFQDPAQSAPLTATVTLPPAAASAAVATTTTTSVPRATLMRAIMAKDRSIFVRAALEAAVECAVRQQTVNQLDASGFGILHYVVALSFCEMTRALIDRCTSAGAGGGTGGDQQQRRLLDINMVGLDGLTPIDLAYQRQQIDRQNSSTTVGDGKSAPTAVMAGDDHKQPPAAVAAAASDEVPVTRSASNSVSQTGSHQSERGDERDDTAIAAAAATAGHGPMICLLLAAGARRSASIARIAKARASPYLPALLSSVHSASAAAVMEPCQSVPPSPSQSKQIAVAVAAAGGGGGVSSYRRPSESQHHQTGNEMSAYVVPTGGGPIVVAGTPNLPPLDRNRDRYEPPHNKSDGDGTAFVAAGAVGPGPFAAADMKQSATAAFGGGGGGVVRRTAAPSQPLSSSSRGDITIESFGGGAGGAKRSLRESSPSHNSDDSVFGDGDQYRTPSQERMHCRGRTWNIFGVLTSLVINLVFAYVLRDESYQLPFYLVLEVFVTVQLAVVQWSLTTYRFRFTAEIALYLLFTCGLFTEFVINFTQYRSSPLEQAAFAVMGTVTVVQSMLLTTIMCHEQLTSHLVRTVSFVSGFMVVFNLMRGASDIMSRFVANSATPALSTALMAGVVAFRLQSPLLWFRVLRSTTVDVDRTAIAAAESSSSLVVGGSPSIEPAQILTVTMVPPPKAKRIHHLQQAVVAPEITTRAHAGGGGGDCDDSDIDAEDDTPPTAALEQEQNQHSNKLQFNPSLELTVLPVASSSTVAAATPTTNQQTPNALSVSFRWILESIGWLPAATSGGAIDLYVSSFVEWPRPVFDRAAPLKRMRGAKYFISGIGAGILLAFPTVGFLVSGDSSLSRLFVLPIEVLVCILLGVVFTAYRVRTPRHHLLSSPASPSAGSGCCLARSRGGDEPVAAGTGSGGRGGAAADSIGCCGTRSMTARNIELSVLLGLLAIGSVCNNSDRVWVLGGSDSSLRATFFVSQLTVLLQTVLLIRLRHARRVVVSAWGASVFRFLSTFMVIFNFVWAVQILMYSDFGVATASSAANSANANTTATASASLALVLLVIASIDMAYRLKCTVLWGRLSAATIDVDDRSGRLHVVPHAD